MIESEENLQNEQLRQKTNTISQSADFPAVFSKEYREYLSYQVAEDAKKQLVDWAKWIVGILALVIAIMGWKTYSDVHDNINKAIDKELIAARNETKKAIEEFALEKSTGLAKLQTQIDSANALITERATQASERIAEIVGGLPSYITSPAISGLTRHIYDAQQSQTLPDVNSGVKMYH